MAKCPGIHRTLFRPGGAHYPRPLLRAPLDFKTLRRPCTMETWMRSHDLSGFQLTFIEIAEMAEIALISGVLLRHQILNVNYHVKCLS